VDELVDEPPRPPIGASMPTTVMPVTRADNAPSATRNGNTSFRKTICLTRLALLKIAVGPRPSTFCTAIQGAKPATTNTGYLSKPLLPHRRL
jgi:hypothetical protein